MKPLISWTKEALHLYAQSEATAVAIQALKNVMNDLEFNIDLDEAARDPNAALQKCINSSIFTREQVRRTLLTLDADVFVKFYFPLDGKTHTDTMPYSVCQDKIVDWARQPVTVTWWPVNFKTYEEARDFSVGYFDTVLRTLKERPVAA